MITVTEFEERLTRLEMEVEDEPDIIYQHPYVVMSNLLAKKEALDWKQASDYVYDFCARKAPEEIEGVGRTISLDPLDMAGSRKPWWCFWRR